MIDEKIIQQAAKNIRHVQVKSTFHPTSFLFGLAVGMAALGIAFIYLFC